MSIKGYEFKKITTSPIFIVLTILFLAYNTVMIISNSNIKSELAVLNEIVNEVGYAINDDMMEEFKTYYEGQLKDASQLLKSRGYTINGTLGEFLERNNVYAGGDSKFNSEDIEQINKAAVIETYYFLSDRLNRQYDTVDINKLAESELANSPYNADVKEIIKKNYEKFELRFQELKLNGEHKNLFFYGKSYRMHSFLFKHIFTTMIYEIMILVVLATSFVLNYEFEGKTAAIVYTTKRGRNIIKDKLLTALGFTVVITTIIMAITLLIYFAVFDYSGLWGASVNSFFSQEYNIPYMTWWNMSILDYLIAVSIVVYVLQLIFCGLTFTVSVLIKNTYIVFGTFAIMVGLGILLPSLVPASLNTVIASVYTPFTLILNPSWYFMFKGGLQLNKYYEVITLVIWGIGVLLLGTLSIYKFKRESIK